MKTMVASAPIMLEEWIGLQVRVIDAVNPAQVGLDGRVIDEGARTIQILKKDGRSVRVQKKGTRLQAKFGNRIAIIEAGDALMRPEERTKRLYRKCMQKK